MPVTSSTSTQKMCRAWCLRKPAAGMHKRKVASVGRSLIRKGSLMSWLVLTLHRSFPRSRRERSRKDFGQSD